MYLILFTLVYCFITRFLSISTGPAFGMILIILLFIKGYYSHKITNISNLEDTKELYRKNGLKDSLIELLSLLLIFINACLIDYEPFTSFEYAYLIFLFAVVYRFGFWGITRTIKERDKNMFQR